MKKIPAEVTKKGDEEVHKHPAFGSIRASRVQGRTKLFGSDFLHQHYVEITVSHGEMHRHLSRDWHFSRDEIISITLSESQWATLVSSMNGPGVCCTLQHINRERIPGIAENVDRRKQFKSEAENTLAIVKTSLDSLSSLVQASGISVKKQKEMLSVIHTAEMNLSENMDFVMEKFGEFIEDTVEKAKQEISSYTQMEAMRLGIASMQTTKDKDESVVLIDEHHQHQEKKVG